MSSSNEKISKINKICNDLIKKYNLFWQYPVITELNVFRQQINNENYIGLPWATIIDKKINITNLIYELKSKLKDKEYITCCQHVSFRKIIPILKLLNIKVLYASHKIINEEYINDIKIIAIPLYAVNIEDVSKNKEFKNIDFINIERNLLYSFIGGYNKNWYLTDIRQRIYNMKHPKNTMVRYTGEWHFEKIVYEHQVKLLKLSDKDINSHNNKTRLYNLILLKSKYSLCPSGSGPNSIRFWESLGCGSIPILLADTYDLPKHNLWDKAVIRVDEKNLEDIPDILNKITNEEENKMRENCLKIYNDFRNNFLQI